MSSYIKHALFDLILYSFPFIWFLTTRELIYDARNKSKSGKQWMVSPCHYKGRLINHSPMPGWTLLDAITEALKVDQEQLLPMML